MNTTLAFVIVAISGAVLALGWVVFGLGKNWPTIKDAFNEKESRHDYAMNKHRLRLAKEDLEKGDRIVKLFLNYEGHREYKQGHWKVIKVDKEDVLLEAKNGRELLLDLETYFCATKVWRP